MNNKIVKYSLFLLALGLIAGTLLGLVNRITAPIIAERAQEAARELLGEHFDYPGFGDKTEELSEGFGPEITNVYFTYDALTGGNVVSVIYQTKARGYSSDVEAFVEIKVDGTFGKVFMIAHKDTPSFADPVFTHDFGITGVSINTYTAVVSGASFTSGAVITGVKAAVKHFKTLGSGDLQ